MKTAFAITASLVYLGATMWTARRLYGRWRAQAIDHAAASDWIGITTPDDAIRSFQADQPFFMLGATLTALTWPLILVGWLLSAGIARWLNTTPIRSRTEQTLQHDPLHVLDQIEHDTRLR